MEQYCEIAYQLYEVVSQNAGVDGGEVHSILDQALAMVQQAAEAIQIPKEVVFMPYRVTQWKHIEKVWKATCEEENTIVRVVPLPYYYKNSWEEHSARCSMMVTSSRRKCRSLHITNILWRTIILM